MLAIPILIFTGLESFFDNLNLLISNNQLFLFLLLGIFSAILSGYFVEVSLFGGCNFDFGDKLCRF